MSTEQALHEIGDDVWAYVQGDGGWGWSNAGLVVDGDASLLVDTLFDLRLTAEMLESMRRASAAAEHIDTVVNTHANGDHCYGNQLVAERRDRRLARQRGRDGRGAAVAARRLRRRRPRPPGAARHLPDRHLRRLLLRGHRGRAADPHVRRLAVAARR